MAALPRSGVSTAAAFDSVVLDETDFLETVVRESGTKIELRSFRP